jgi:hypothetical protein
MEFVKMPRKVTVPVGSPRLKTEVMLSLRLETHQLTVEQTKQLSRFDHKPIPMGWENITIRIVGTIHKFVKSEMKTLFIHKGIPILGRNQPSGWIPFIFQMTQDRMLVANSRCKPSVPITF